jgi:hypothetical protein
MGVDPASLMTAESSQRFERLFSTIHDRLYKLTARAADPFH